ncbi:hypothetical protein [Tomitella fengzijianii]|uniref:Lipoprotein n=1 Tax=Tomitella fengzijianii TaxID=2597660 RepID=A0A516WYX7_9ACTN|nr:hypothetical protein [Tomitella fengzijianii]QDQ96044.1 hypothetical protein FO059_00190 [Tomitella fengzijianii]
MRQGSVKVGGVVALCALAACGLSACGSDDSSGAMVDGKWFMQTGSQVEGIVTATAGEDAVGGFMLTDVEFRDSDDEVLASTQGPAMVSWADQQFAVPVDAVVPGDATVASMTVTTRVSDEKFSDLWSRIEAADSYEITGDGPREFTARFLLHGLPDETQVGSGVTMNLGVACYDAAGGLIGGTAEQVPVPATGGLLRVDAQVAADGRPDTCRAFPGHL